jgi:hypothetical protein
VAVWLAALAGVALWGWWLESSGQQDLVLLGSQPFLGGLLTPQPVRLVLPVAVAALGVWGLPRIAAGWRWGRLLPAIVAFGSVWAWALSSARGWQDFLRPLYRDDDYFTALPIPDVPAFLSAFTDDLLGYAVHVQGHPPGPVVVLVLLDRIGLAQPWLVAGLYVLLGTSAMAAAAVAMKALSGSDGEALARWMLPAAALAPAAVWVAVSPDAYFGGVLAWGVAWLAVASARRSQGKSWHSWVPAAFGSGLLLGLCPFLSYGLLPMGLLVFVVLWHSRQWRVFAVVSVLVAAQALAWAAAGFWLPDGIAATAQAWRLNGASVRPYWYFAVANFVVLAALVGPAALTGLTRLRRLHQPAAAFVIAALTAAACGALLGFMRGEVERIWLPLTAWILLAAAATRARRAWLVAQAVVAVTVAALIDSPW